LGACEGKEETFSEGERYKQTNQSRRKVIVLSYSTHSRTIDTHCGVERIQWKRRLNGVN